MLTERSIRYIIRELKKCRGTKLLAEEMNVSQRRIQQLWAEYQRTGKVHTQGRAGRPREADPADAEIEMVLDIHRRWPDGVQLTVRRLRKSGSDISYSKVCRILKSNDLVTASPAKSRQRKWVRYERLYSNAMWHTDWHTMKDPRMEGLNLITYLDDASRCVTGAALFQEATSENAVMVLRQAVDRFGVPATILSDNGSCFVGRGGRKRPAGSWTPTLFEDELLALNIVLDQLTAIPPTDQRQAGAIPSECRGRDMALCQSCRLYRILQHRQATLGSGHRQLRDSDAGLSQQGSC